MSNALSLSFLLASANKHKADEIQEFFQSKNKSISVCPAEKSLVVEETGTSFFENSFIKAEAYYKKFQKPTLADDSGLCVSALPNDLGVQSARFGGEGFSDLERCNLLLEKLKHIEDQNQNRSAYFVCVLCFYINPSEAYFFEGRLNGKIANGLSGNFGFGYDPLFIPDFHDSLELNNKMLSLAEVPEWKSNNSHRAKALYESIKFFTEKRIESLSLTTHN